MATFMDPDPTAMDRLRVICAEFPQVTEHETASHVVFRIGRRNVINLFAVLGDAGSAVTMISARAPEDEVDDLVAVGHPFFRVGGAHGHRSIGMVLDGDTDWAEVAEVATDSYCLVAPKRLVAALDLPT